MKCSVCNENFVNTIQTTLYQEVEKQEYSSSSLKIISFKTMCMECFLRISGIANNININDVQDIWFKKVDNGN